jgi:ketosteroid isomerase-like protein
MPSPRSLAAALFLALAATTPLRAQGDVFGMGGNTPGDARRRFEVEAREQVSALLLDYESAWGSHDATGLARLYARNATLYPAAEGMLTGRGAIHDYLHRTLPGVPAILTRILELRASGDLVVTTVQVRRKGADQGPDALETDVFVLRRDAVGGWTILSHLARPEGALAAGGTSTPTAAAPADSAH